MTLDKTLQLAIQYHQTGDLQHAEHFYKELLQFQPDNFYALHYLGVLYYQTRNYDPAINYIKKALQINPHDSHAYYNLGTVFKDQGQLDEAVIYFQKALEYNSANHDAYVNLGIVLKDKGNLDEAINCYQKAIQLNPDLTAAHYNLGYILQIKNNLDEAIIHYQKAIQLNPDLTAAHYNLGYILQIKNNLDEAIIHYQKAIQLNPDLAAAYINLGLLFYDKRLFDKAIKCYQKALQLNPKSADTYNNLGVIFKEKKQFDEAIDCYQKASQIDPNLPDTYNGLGSVLKEKGRFDEAIEYYQKALQLNPDFHSAYNNLGVVLKEKGQLDKAIDCFNKALQLNPNSAEAYNNLGVIFKDKGQLDDATTSYQKALNCNPKHVMSLCNLGNVHTDQGKLMEAEYYYRLAIQIEPDFASCYSNLLMMMNYTSHYSAQAIFTEHLQFAKQIAEPLGSVVLPHTNDPSPSRRLKIGYVSPDFRRHSVKYFLEPVLASHSHEQFEVFCYSDTLIPDSITKRLQEYSDQWRNIVGASDEKVAELIRKDGIDILIDLAGHTGQNRMLLFARKPAPIQVSWLGYPNTTGLRTIDYRLVDEYTDPPGLTDQFYTEKLLRLPESFLCYLPDKDCPDISELPALTAGKITFGSFNYFPKVSPETVALWSKILKTIPNSRLIMKALNFSDRTTCQYALEMFAEHDVSAEQITLVSLKPSYREHLVLYNSIDVGLDTFPYNGTTTTCDALWMGVPVISLLGDTHASRVGKSILSNIGLSYLVAKSPDEYLEIAINLSKDLSRLQSLRENCRYMILHSPLTDAKQFTANLEQCYRIIWERWCMKAISEGLPHLKV
ncbi:MAG: tetratricopeptide repeat protein [Nitrospira sp.]|nr:tetratricopeptide repeat protein [Nitrospira sp.]